MTRVAAATLLVLAVLVAGCGSGAAPGSATPARTVPSRTAAPAPTATRSPVASTATAAAIVTVAPPSTAAAAGETGVAGIVTLGPTCPVQRIDSLCPDRPYAARITAWRGGVQVVATTSGADGRFVLLLAPGDYRIVGESAGGFPRGSSVDVTVAAGRLTSVQLHYDTGIR